MGGIALAERDPCPAELRSADGARLVEEGERLLEPALPPAELGERDERPADPCRARPGVVLDSRLELRLGVVQRPRLMSTAP